MSVADTSHVRANNKWSGVRLILFAINQSGLFFRPINKLVRTCSFSGWPLLQDSGHGNNFPSSNASRRSRRCANSSTNISPVQLAMRQPIECAHVASSSAMVIALALLEYRRVKAEPREEWYTGREYGDGEQDGGLADKPERS